MQFLDDFSPHLRRLCTTWRRSLPWLELPTTSMARSEGGWEGSLWSCQGWWQRSCLWEKILWRLLFATPSRQISRAWIVAKYSVQQPSLMTLGWLLRIRPFRGLIVRGGREIQSGVSGSTSSFLRWSGVREVTESTATTPIGCLCIVRPAQQQQQIRGFSLWWIETCKNQRCQRIHSQKSLHQKEP